MKPSEAEARTSWGVEIEARHREALHSALITGVRHALSRGLQERGNVAEAAVDYVRTSVPDGEGLETRAAAAGRDG